MRRPNIVGLCDMSLVNCARVLGADESRIAEIYIYILKLMIFAWLLKDICLDKIYRTLYFKEIHRCFIFHFNGGESVHTLLFIFQKQNVPITLCEVSRTNECDMGFKFD